jgi:phenylalanyl-tRNA synthetase beta chain
MKAPYSWLKEFVPCDLPASELGQMMTMQGSSVEELEYLGAGLEEIKVGHILEMGKHPNADKLTLCRVTDGEEEYSIVCGATNHKQGDKVALALPGVKLPAFEGKPLKKAKIRGVESFGMLCSERELGLGEDHAGIIILPEDAPVGAPFTEVAGLDDTLIEFEITANRGDCLSILGLAREMAAAVDKPIQLPPTRVEKPLSKKTDFTVEIHDFDLCPRYTARVIEGVKIGPSPKWMQRRLEACGVRSINNIVDISNYVLLEFGHPLHAFDLDTLQGRKIIVRRARPGETLLTLDDQERKLHEDDLVIADAERPVALAGVMGGAETEVSETTVNLLIESAYFDPTSIRKTSKKMGLSTEASYRFERGTDWEGLVDAGNRCCRLIEELAEGKVVGDLIDIQPEEGSPERLVPRKVELRVSRCNQVLGIHLSPGETMAILKRIGFTPGEKGEDLIEAPIPAYRNDIEREIDLIEEVARIYGYNKIKSEVPRTPGRTQVKPWRDTYLERVRSRMQALGFRDTLNSAFLGPELLDRMRLTEDDDLRKAVRVMNPLSVHESLLRTSLLPSILDALGRNARRLNHKAAIFEIARVYLPELSDPTRCERRVISGGAYGPLGEGWLAKKEDFYNFFDAKGAVEALLEMTGVEDYRFEPVDLPFLQPGRSAKLLLGDRQAGVLGEAHPETAEQFGIRERTMLFEIDLDAIRRQTRGDDIQFSAPPAYPATSRDFSFIAGIEQPVAELEQAVRKAAGKNLEDCYLSAVFEGGRIPPGKRSLSFRLVFRAPDRTLTDEEVNKQQDRILRSVEKQFGATLMPD